MPNLSTQSPSQTFQGVTAVPDETNRNYDLEDFSQRAINRGQRQINYLITDVDEKIVEAFRQVSYAIAKCCNQVDLKALEKAIEEVSEATKKVASIYPPGCGSPSLE